METPESLELDAVFDPLDLVETILNEEALDYERTPDGDICFSLSGGWQSYDMWFSWNQGGECLQLCAGLGAQDLDTLSNARLMSLYELLALVNQRVWFGHFELYQEDHLDANKDLSYGVYSSAKSTQSPAKNTDIVFRHALAVSALERPSVIAMAHMINRAAEAVDCFFPAFDFWLSGSKSAHEAIEACLFETLGEA